MGALAVLDEDEADHAQGREHLHGEDSGEQYVGHLF
jgi:hypothetical protein